MATVEEDSMGQTGNDDEHIRRSPEWDVTHRIIDFYGKLTPELQKELGEITTILPGSPLIPGIISVIHKVKYC